MKLSRNPILFPAALLLAFAAPGVFAQSANVQHAAAVADKEASDAVVNAATAETAAMEAQAASKANPGSIEAAAMAEAATISAQQADLTAAMAAGAASNAEANSDSAAKGQVTERAATQSTALAAGTAAVLNAQTGVAAADAQLAAQAAKNAPQLTKVIIRSVPSGDTVTFYTDKP